MNTQVQTSASADEAFPVTALCALTVARFHCTPSAEQVPSGLSSDVTERIGEKNVSYQQSLTSSLASTTLGTFVVGSSEFAIDIEYIQEVVNYPHHIDVLPNAKHFLRGIFNLRGMVVPVIDMKLLLGVQPTNTENEHHEEKIVIVRYQGVYAGLTVDTTKEILKIRSENRIGVGYATDNEIRILKSVLRTPDNPRLVQEIDVPALYHLARIEMPQTQNHDSMQGQSKGAVSKCILFHVGTGNLAIDIHQLHGIRDAVEISASEVKSALCAGMISFRGVNAPVLQLESFIPSAQGKKNNNSTEKRVLILGHDIGYMGLLIDAVESINTYYPSDIVDASSFSSHEDTLYKGCLDVNEQTQALMLDSDAMFQHPPMRELVVAFRNLYRQEYTKNARSAEVLHRCTYLVFRVAGITAGVDVQFVKEILNYSNSMHPAPAQPDYVAGLIRHRNNLIRVVDMQAFYGLQSSNITTNDERKIIVMEVDGVSLGVIVDGLETSVTVLNNNKTVLPSIMSQNNQLFERFGRDTKEFIQVKSEHEGSVAFVELSPHSFMQNLQEQLYPASDVLAA